MAKSRSPRKPSIDLERAVELATTLHRQILNHSSAKETVLQHWGYSPKSSNGLVAFGALRQFGLIDQRRGQDAKLSPLALEIVLDERPDSPERDEAVCRAALNPILHQELWSKYAGKLPSDADIKLYLQRDKSFPPSGAEDFIKQFRATISYANLTSPEPESNGGEDKLEEPTLGQSSAGSPQPNRQENVMEAEAAERDLSIPLPGKRLATLRTPVSLTSADHKILTGYLELMRDSLISDSEAGDAGSSSDD